MRYVRAQDIFPVEVLELIQTYVNGEYIYIPRKEDAKLAWGEKSQGRQELARRNAAVYQAYLQGNTTEELSQRFYLSPQSIRRILREEKKKTA